MKMTGGRESYPAVKDGTNWRMDEELPGVRIPLVRIIGGMKLVKASWTEG